MPLMHLLRLTSFHGSIPYKISLLSLILSAAVQVCALKWWRSCRGVKHWYDHYIPLPRRPYEFISYPNDYFPFLHFPNLISFILRNLLILKKKSRMLFMLSNQCKNTVSKFVTSNFLYQLLSGVPCWPSGIIYLIAKYKWCILFVLTTSLTLARSADSN